MRVCTCEAARRWARSRWGDRSQYPRRTKRCNQWELSWGSRETTHRRSLSRTTLRRTYKKIHHDDTLATCVAPRAHLSYTHKLTVHIQPQPQPHIQRHTQASILTLHMRDPHTHARAGQPVEEDSAAPAKSPGVNHFGRAVVLLTEAGVACALPIDRLEERTRGGRREEFEEEDRRREEDEGLTGRSTKRARKEESG